MNVPFIVLDFESYFDDQFSLKRMTIPVYVADPRFRAHGIAIRHPDGRAEFRTDVQASLAALQAEYGSDLECAIVVCHNCSFDLYVLNHRFGIRPRKFIDTKLLAYQGYGRRSAAGGQDGSLKSLAEKFGLAAKGDLDFMRGVIEPNAQQLAELASYACNDVEITFQLALFLLPKVSPAEVEIPLMMHTVRLYTERGVQIDVDAIPKLKAQISEETQKWFVQAGVNADTVSKDSLFTPLLEAALARTERLVPMKQGKNGLIPAISKKDEAMQGLLEDDDPVVSALAHARIQKKSEDQLISKLETLEAITKATGGVLPIGLECHGAGTGRFAAFGKFSMQNLGKTGFGLNTRKLLLPRPGHKFVGGDLSQIEARATASIAGQSDLSAAFANGEDVYSTFASEVLNVEVRKPRKEDSEQVKEFLKPRREIGKTAILGLGFQLGALKFYNGLRSNRLVTPLFVSGELNAQVCKNIVTAFREKYWKIAKLWSDLEEAFRQAIIGVNTACHRLGFYRSGNEVCIRLPSRRVLRYPDARLEERTRAIRYMDRNGEEAEFTPSGDSIIYGKDTALYGGKICENVIQAFARDILVEAILRLEAAGWKVVFHVHDEIVLEVREEDKDRAEAALKAELKRAPWWTLGLRLECETSVMDCYSK